MSSVVQLTRTSSLVGKAVYTRGGTTAVHAFLGVPFAKPPLGDLRFQPPQPAEPWSGQRDATKFGPICPQDLVMSARTHRPFPMPTSICEDCLYLNVWTPTLDPGRRQPVMFWIYGGSFSQGFSNYYDGTALAAFHDVVFVSINYRVGPFGFLCTGDGVVPGNAGLLDQVAALKWVRTNIAKFGGDPGNITVFGESAGAISTSFHLCSPLSRGLFRRAICQSGVALHPMSAWPQRNARKYMLKKLQAIGCHETDSKKIVEYLSQFPGQELIDKIGSAFNPVRDNTFIPDDPHKLYPAPEGGSPVDLLLGFNKDEGAQFVFMLAQALSVSRTEDAHGIIETVIKKMFFRGSPAGDRIVRAVMERYFRDVDGMSPDRLTQALSDMYGDVLFIAPAVNVANRHADVAPTYLYHFTHRPSMSSYPAWVTADHGQEIPLVVGEPWLPRFRDIWSDGDKAVSRTLMAYWTNFAKTGDPNGPGLPVWPRYTRRDEQYLQLDATPETRERFEPGRMALWNDTVQELVSDANKTPAAKY